MASVLDQIKQLDQQRSALLEGAKQEALTAAQTAIDTLNELGYSYRIVEGTERQTSSATVRTGNSPRRTGIREQVLQMVTEGNGVSRKDLIEAMGGKGDKSAEQSISNALSALKKAGSITLQNGKYTAA